MLTGVTNILAHQFMFKRSPTRNILASYSMHKSLSFFKIRSEIDSSLLPNYDKWRSAVLMMETKTEKVQ